MYANTRRREVTGSNPSWFTAAAPLTYLPVLSPQMCIAWTDGVAVTPDPDIGSIAALEEFLWRELMNVRVVMKAAHSAEIMVNVHTCIQLSWQAQLTHRLAGAPAEETDYKPTR